MNVFDVKIDRFIIKVSGAISTMNAQLEKHIDILDKSLNENDLKYPYFRNLWLKQSLNILKSIRTKINYVANDYDVNSIIKITVKSYNDIVNIGINKKLKYLDVERETLPKDFLDSFLMTMFCIEYLEKLKITTDKLKITDDILKIKKLMKYYESLFKREFICTEGCESLEEYNEFKNKILN